MNSRRKRCLPTIDAQSSMIYFNVYFSSNLLVCNKLRVIVWQLSLCLLIEVYLRLRCGLSDYISMMINILQFKYHTMRLGEFSRVSLLNRRFVRDSLWFVNPFCTGSNGATFEQLPSGREYILNKRVVRRVCHRKARRSRTWLDKPYVLLLLSKYVHVLTSTI